MFQNFYLSPASVPAITDEKEIDNKYRYWRKRVLYSAFIGYAFYYFCRVNISMALPYMQKDLDFNKFQLGLIVSVLQIAYGVGKRGSKVDIN